MSEDRRDDELQLRSIISAQEAAWNRGDAAAFAETFDREGSFTNVLGAFFVGQEAFRDRHALLFAGPFAGSSTQLEIVRLHFTTIDTACVDLLATLRNARAGVPGLSSSGDGGIRSRLLEVFARTGGQWRVVAYHNVDIKPAPP